MSVKCKIKMWWKCRGQSISKLNNNDTNNSYDCERRLNKKRESALIDSLRILFCILLFFLPLKCTLCEFLAYPVTDNNDETFQGYQIYNEFKDDTKEAFLDKLLTLANKVRSKSGGTPVQVDQQLCRVIRNELLRIVKTYPHSDRKPKQINFAYANFTNLKAQPVEFEKGINFICCDKAVRGIVETFIICGFSKHKFKMSVDAEVESVILKEFIKREENEYYKKWDQKEQPASNEISALEFGPVIAL